MYGNINESERLKSLISGLGISQKSLAEDIGVSRAQINLIVKGERALTENIVYRIERKFPNVNAEWLMTGEGQMFKAQDSDTDESDLQEIVRKQKEELARMADQLMREKKLNDDLIEVLKKISAWKDVSDQ